MGKAVRLSDIAQRASVSTVTVSKALSGQKGVSEEKRALIIQLAKEMGYRKTVSSGGQKKSYTIGVVASERFLDGHQSFYWAFYQEISRCATACGNLPVLKVVSPEDEKKGEIPEMIRGEQIKGLILLGTFQKKFEENLIHTVRVPYVYLDSYGMGRGSDCVVTDNMRMAFMVTNYLLSMGHTKIGFVGTTGMTDSVDDRFLGYQKALLEHGLSPMPQYCLADRDRETGMIDPDRYFTLRLDDMPTAYVCSCDVTANCLIYYLQKEGFSVPDDISITGFDDFLPEDIAGIGITTCRVDIGKMTENALGTLIAKIEKRAYTQGIYEVSGSLVVRESVKKIGKAVPFI